jgi:predicted GH43/DUF377 family glycosyl hydrolase
MNSIQTRSIGKLRPLWLALGPATAVILLTLLLWGIGQGGISAAPTAILYVDGASGGDTGTCGTTAEPCQTIAYTLNNHAIGGDTINVAEGTYAENLTFSGLSVTLVGGFAVSGAQWDPGGGATIIDGADTDRVIFVHDGSNVVLEQLTLMNGRAPEAACWGGGLSVTNGQATLRHVIVQNNQAVCTSGLSGGGGGGGLNANADEGPANLYVEDSIITGNQAGDHGSALNTDNNTVEFTNVMVFGNGPNVLGIHNTTFTMVNSTVAMNDGSGSALLDFDSQSNITVVNSIIWDSGSVNCGNGGSSCSFTYSDIQGGWPDTGNINNDPQFVDPPNGDYHLQAWSPAIDAGTAVGAPALDFEGDARPQNSGIDMGADEFVGTPINNVGSRYMATTGSDAGPNLCLDPGTPCQTIGQAASLANGGETVLIAGGTYLENLVLNKPLNLEGGYEASGWTRDLALYETIIDGSGSPTVIGDWDGQAVQKAAVLNDGGVYKMWFDGQNLFSEVQVGYATSNDGLAWDKYLSNPVLSPVPNTWESRGGEISPFVLIEGGVYKMWYENSDGGVRQTGYATSTNGIDWQKYPGNPILHAGPEAYDQQVAGHGTVLNDNGVYKLWYHAMGDQGAIIAYATSPDGIDWTKQGPALLPGGSGDWDEFALWGPTVLKLGSTYWMWYAGSSDLYGPAIGAATSADGVTWNRVQTDPMVIGNGPIGDPHVIDDGGTLKMWYTNYEQGVIKYAESVDGINWTTYPNDPALVPGAAGQWGGPVVQLDPGSGGTVLDGLTITGGSDGFGGGVHAGGEDVVIGNSLITGNYASGAPDNQGGAGILGGIGGGSVIIENSRIIDNEVGQGAGGVRVHQGQLTVTNSLIADNRGDAGIHVNGPLSLLNVTVANNDGGVVFNPPDGVLMTAVNSIIYDTGGLWTDVGVIEASYSDIEGGVWPGTGNIDAPPEFADGPNGDYHLLGISPAINAGTPANAPPADLDGTPRDVTPDMGAYEFQRFDHDLNVTNVLPAGEVAVNVAVPIRATLYNVGLNAESNVPVTCTISDNGGQIYQETVNSGSLSPLTWEVLTFPAFTPASAGSYDVVCESALLNDGNLANDAYARVVTAVAEIADVWTRDNPGDNGDVPSDLNNWYESPDLWVRNNDDGGLLHQDPIAGVENFIYVRLRNRGTVAITGTVDVYWIEPSLGVRCGDWAYVDTVAFSDLLPGETRIVKAAWTPTRTGHTCLQDVIDSPQDPYNRGLECSPLWVPWDNNVEWHNVNILSNPSQGLLAATDVKTADVQLVNVYNLPQDVDLIIDRRTFPTAGTITVQLPEALFDRWQASANGFGDGIQVNGGTKEIEITGEISGTIGAIPMEAAEKQQVSFVFDGPAGLTFELAVRERIEGVTVGGLTYQWTIPDTTPPAVSSVTPANMATGQDLNAPIVITFDEPVSPLNFNLTMTPDPDGWQYVWNDASTAVTASHNPLDYDTTYNLSLTTSDAANNVMTTPYAWSFTTAKAYIFLPIVIR